MTVRYIWRNKKLGIQRGDTLVEVLITILLLAAVLTGAYVTVSQSSKGVRDSQEHGEALKLVQGQVEQIRQNGSMQPAAIFTQPLSATFCMVDAVVQTGAACTRNRSDQQAGTNEQPAYKLEIRRTDCGVSATPPCHKFVVTASWDSVTNNGRAEETIATRMYQ